MRFFLLGCAYELSFGLLALLLIYIFDIPWTAFEVDFWHFVWLTPLACLPAVLFLSPWGRYIPGQTGVLDVIRQSLGEFICQAPVWQLFILSACAGFAEELLFRGVIQVKLGILIASVLFGLMHYTSHLYFFMATLMGLYLGYVFEHTQRDLALVMLIHALYDFLLLLYMRHFGFASESLSSAETDDAQP